MVLDEPFTLEETIKVIEILKTGKASSIDEISPEV